MLTAALTFADGDCAVLLPVAGCCAVVFEVPLAAGCCAVVFEVPLPAGCCAVVFDVPPAAGCCAAVFDVPLPAGCWAGLAVGACCAWLLAGAGVLVCAWDGWVVPDDAGAVLVDDGAVLC